MRAVPVTPRQVMFTVCGQCPSLHAEGLMVCVNDKHKTKAFFCAMKVQETMTLSRFISGCGFPAINYPESLRTLRLE